MEILKNKMHKLHVKWELYITISARSQNTGTEVLITMEIIIYFFEREQ